ncbi:PREDICTED: sialic acid-binding Ig-like lectin 14 [Chinchilla lanigera]|uniref:sialic acid-binding Ig-like lectin 14 n=1 Tax=Chinchilla lanigera TaxID=34839 RepID=UPI000698E19C|nr:PREDICTED: sialic acid-binding Ig-like lectin 14 [Chinchilla lanigera]
MLHLLLLLLLFGLWQDAAPSVNISNFLRNCTVPLVPMTMSNDTSPIVQEGQSLHLVCTADNNSSSSLSWLWKSRDLNSSQVSASRVLELCSVGPQDGQEFTCQVHHPLGFQNFSLKLFVQAEKQEGSWPLCLTLIIAVGMVAGSLLTYVLTWIYYTRCGGAQEHNSVKPQSPTSS